MSKKLTAYSIFALVWLAFLIIFTWGYWEDDAFIHLEFASSLYEGRRFSFNGLTTYGDTSPAWVFMLVIFHYFIQDWYIAGKILALLGVAFAISGMFFFVRRITDKDPRGNEIAAISILLILINPYFIFWAFSGMEAVTAFGLIFWLLYLILPPAPSSPNQNSENSSDLKVLTKLSAIAALIGIAPLLRPESILISFIAFIYSFIYPASDFKRLKDINIITARSIFLLIAIAPVALWIAYAFSEFGKILPNTNAAKKIQGGIGETFLRMIHVYLLGFGVPLVIIALAPLIKIFCRDSSKPRADSTLFSRDACILAICWIVLLSVFYLLNKTNVQTRYALLIGPLFIIFSTLILYEYSTSARGRLLFNLGLISMVLVNLLLFAVSVAPHLLNKVKTVDQIRQLTSFINMNIPEKEPIAVYAIGQIGFETKNPIIDTGGITMPEVVQFLGSEEKVKNWAIAKGAKYFIGDSQHGFNKIFEREGYFLGWSLNPNAYRQTQTVYLYRID